jgi:hypothetical protein
VNPRIAFDLPLSAILEAVSSSGHHGYDERPVVKNASVPDDKAAPIYHHFEAPIAATNANTVARRTVPKTILYSWCGPARLSTKRSALDGLISESRRAILSKMPIPARRGDVTGALGVRARKALRFAYRSSHFNPVASRSVCVSGFQRCRFGQR